MRYAYVALLCFGWLAAAPAAAQEEDDDPKRAGSPAAPATPAPAPVIPPAPSGGDEALVPGVPDTALRAVRRRTVVVQLRDGRELTGEVLAFDADTLTLATAGDGDVLTIRRPFVVRLRAAPSRYFADPDPPRARGEAPPPAEPDKERHLGIHLGITPGFALDVEYGYFYGFISGNIVFPMATAGDTWGTALGAGASFPITRGSRWRFDLFAHVGGSRLESFDDTFVAFGVGVGVHYTSRGGFSFGVKTPILGWAVAGDINRSEEAIASYFAGSAIGFPLVSFGYRF